MTRETPRERKVATLLFADLADFTGLSETHDPEVVSALVASTFERLARVVEDHEGTIEKFAGDAMLAVFGVPVAHEDDPERAVRAGLSMQEAMAAIVAASAGRAELALRIGVETGEVLVDHARLGGERDLFVTGDAVNVAARLESAAPTGGILVGPVTHGATRGVVDYEELAPLDLKGKAEPVPAFRALAVGPRPNGRSRTGLAAPLVGRDRELAQLRDAIEAAVAERRPRLITVVGGAGVGKSRLARELLSGLEAASGHIHVRTGRCLAYAGPTFGPIADIIKADAGITDDDPPRVVLDKLRLRLDVLPTGNDQGVIQDALEAALAVGTERDRSRGELFEAWRHYLEAIATTAPLLLIIEDVHWADETVLAFIGQMARMATGPIAILCLARHELLETRPDWGQGLPASTTIVLEPLDASATTALVDGLLAGGIPEALGDRIVELSEGNPLFAQEIVGMLVDQGTLRETADGWELAHELEQVEIPGSVHAVLAARLDSLSPAEKRVAQDASVIGRIFWDRLVAHLAGEELSATGERIRDLEVKELVAARRPSTLAGAQEFGFQHVLIRDVAYDTLPKRDRARLHRDVAAWTEETLADRIGEFVELVAGHLLAAVAYEEELAVAPGQALHGVRQDAFDAALRAGRRASSLGLRLRSRTWMNRAIELAEKLDVGPRELGSLLDEDAQANGSVGDGPDLAALGRAIEGLESMPQPSDDDVRLLARLRSAKGSTLYWHHVDVDAARETLSQGVEALEDGPPTAERAQLLRLLGWTYWHAGPVDDAVPLCERALAEAEACGDAEAYRWSLHELSAARSFSTLAKGNELELMEESYRLAREADDRRLLNRCNTNLPVWGRLRGEPLEPLIAMLEDGLRDTRRESEGETDPVYAYNLAWLLEDAGRPGPALVHLDEAIPVAVSRGLPPATLYNSRAIAHRRLGDIAAAKRDEATLRGLDIPEEPQARGAILFGSAWSRWAADPHAATAELVDAMEHGGLVTDVRDKVAQQVARMALRLDDRELLERAVAVYDDERSPGAAANQALHASVDGLVANDGGHAVEAAAVTLEELGYIRRAIDAWADAAVLAKRAGRSSIASERVKAITARTGLLPLPD